MNIQVKPEEILEFFEQIIPDQIHLSAIDPNKRRPLIARDFGADALAAMKWALERNAQGDNVYFSVNRVRSGLNSKPSKADIVGVRFCHLDKDPPKGAASFTADEKRAVEQQLMALDPRTIVFSGNGYQAILSVAHGTTAAQAEQINRGLIEALGGDVGTHDVSRLLRVPGLINYPDVKKRSLGREPALARIRYAEDSNVFDATELLRAFPVSDRPVDVAERGAINVGDWQPLTADDLGLPEDAYLRRLIQAPDGLDRSADVFHFACEGLRYGLSAPEVVGVLLNPENEISSHCLDQENPERAAKRAIEAALGEEDVRALARSHDRERERALAAGELELQLDETKVWTLDAMLRDCVFIEDGCQVADISRIGYTRNLSEFRAATAASTLVRELPGRNGSVRKVKTLVADAWLADPRRRTVSTRTFKAGDGPITTGVDGQTALNAWRGYRIVAPPSDWAIRSEPFVKHCNGLFGSQSEHFLDWTSHIAQKPRELPSTAWLHISKKTGTGRNLIASILGRAFIGYTALAYPLSDNLHRGFNGELAGKVLAVVDEIDEGNSHRKYELQQDLKRLITEEHRLVNPKCERQRMEFNSCRFLIFSNSPAALPLEEDDRRFNVVQFEGEPQAPEYYSELYRLRDDPDFIASVMQFLLSRDISHFNPGERAHMSPAKAALLERTRSEHEQVMHDIVDRWPVDIITSSEVRGIIGERALGGPAMGHALARANIAKVGQWFAPSIFGGRTKVIAYAVRNLAEWRQASSAKLRAEVNRLTEQEKEDALYGIADA